ncbi:hypothetical protein QYF61_017196 [Mycteria americana]|uniref:Uncharacterized protein n=1 Tax=Mycteria americana TaxID=33587 RepID=A0AAN7S2W4_MYCAM|nr:hypothetical protein QYF61_017196 [Mycteria americana]
MKREPDSSQWCAMKEKSQWAQISKKKLFYSEGGQTLEQVAQRTGVVAILRVSTFVVGPARPCQLGHFAGCCQGEDIITRPTEWYILFVMDPLEMTSPEA